MTITLPFPAASQYQFPTCQAHVANSLARFRAIAQGLPDPGPLSDLSALYWGQRQGTFPDVWAGCAIGLVLRGMVLDGYTTEALWPETVPNLGVAPDATARAYGLAHRVKKHAKVPLNLTGVLAALAAGNPVGIAGYFPSDFWTSAAGGVCPMPDPTDKGLPHSVLAYQDDKAGARILCRNSAGPDWGLAGDFWLPYGFFQPKNNRMIEAVIVTEVS